MRVVITQMAEAAIRSAATNLDDSSAKRLPNGLWEIEMGVDTLTRLEGLAFKGESLSDTIERIVADVLGRRRN